MMNLKKKINFQQRTALLEGPRKNKRVKYLIVKKIKTQTMQTKHDIKKWMKIIRAKLENKKN